MCAVRSECGGARDGKKIPLELLLAAHTELLVVGVQHEEEHDRREHRRTSDQERPNLGRLVCARAIPYGGLLLAFGARNATTIEELSLRRTPAYAVRHLYALGRANGGAAKSTAESTAQLQHQDEITVRWHGEDDIVEPAAAVLDEHLLLGTG